MLRLAYLACCASLALGLASPTLAGPLGSAASDAFRRLPQNAPAPTPPAQAADPAPTLPAAAAEPAASASSTAGPAPAAAIDPLPDPANPLPPEPPAYTGGTGTGGGFAGIDIRGVPSRIPEPGMLWLLGVGGAGLALALARKRRK